MSFSPHPSGTVILRDSPPSGASRWLAFAHPEQIIEARTVDAVAPLIRRVEEAVAGGLHAAGFLAYEAAPAFDPACRTQVPAAGPHALRGSKF